MSEQASKQVSDNVGDVVGAGPAAPESTTAVPSTSVPVNDWISAGPDKPEAPAVSSEARETPKDPPKVEAAVDAPTPEANAEAKPEAPASPGKVIIMPPVRDHGWSSEDAGRKTQSADVKPGIFGKRRVAALAAVIALAAIAGALGGALATAGLRHLPDDGKLAGNRALEDSISRIDTELAALRTSLEQAAKHSAAQIGKTSDRLDKVEKAQIEPAAKLAKLGETVEKLRVAAAAPAPVPAAAPAAPAPAAAATPVAPKETTASVQTANAAPVPLPEPKPEIARLPTVEGWVLRDVANGTALIEGRRGMFEVYAGDPIPGLGRVDAIRKQDGRWVVVTSRGLIVGR